MIGALRRPRAGSIGTLAWPAALIVVALAAGSASARPSHCGSQVVRPGEEALRGALGLASLTDEGPLAEEAEPAGRPSPGDRPCDGPSCSRGSSPLPITPPSVPPPPEHWACFGAAMRPAEPFHLPLPDPDDGARPDRIPIGIFHPPRVG